MNDLLLSTKITMEDKNKEIFLLRTFLIVVLTAWLASIPLMLRFTEGISLIYSYVLRVIPFVIFLIIIFILNLSISKKDSYPKFNLIQLSDPVIIFLFYLIYSLFISLTTLSDYYLFFLAYGYLTTYFLAVFTAGLAYSYIFNKKILTADLCDLKKNQENPVCQAAYWAAVLLLIVVIFKEGITDIYLSEGRIFGETQPAALGLLALTIIMYPIVFRWTILRIILFVGALLILFKGESRTAIISILIACTSVLFIKAKKMTSFIIIIIFLILMIFPSITYLISEDVLFFSDQHRGIHTLSGRLQVWQNIWNIFLKNPIIGIGFRTSDYWLTIHNIGTSHNAYLASLLETGIIGTFLLLLAICLTLSSLVKLSWNYRDKSALFFFGLLFGSCFFAIGERYILNVGNPTSLMGFFALFHARLTLMEQKLPAYPGPHNLKEPVAKPSFAAWVDNKKYKAST